MILDRWALDLKKRKPQCSQVGEEKLITVRQLGHCRIGNPLLGSAKNPRTGLIPPKSADVVLIAELSLLWLQLIPGSFQMQGMLLLSQSLTRASVLDTHFFDFWGPRDILGVPGPVAQLVRAPA